MSKLCDRCDEFKYANSAEIVSSLGAFGILASTNEDGITLSLIEARELVGLLEDYHTCMEENH